MKTLINPKVNLSPDGKQVTIIADVVDQGFNMLITTRVSHHYLNTDHIRHPRRIQSSNQAVFLESPKERACMPNEFIAAVFAVVAPNTTFAPVFKSTSTPQKVEVISETPVTYQWQISDDPAPEGTFPPPKAVWVDISGETNAILDESKVAVGKWVRCVATNATGSTITKYAQKK